MRCLLIFLMASLLAACAKEEAKPQTRPPTEVSVIKVVPQDTPVSSEFVGQSESSRQVQIVARVNGFLDKRVYTEGSLVKAGQVMFLQDPKPLQATLDANKAALAEQRARLQTANADLDRVKPLATLNALSQKDLDDATGRQEAAAAAVQMAEADVEQAKLNLGYTTITTPVTGLSSYARVQEGAYLNPANSLLTYVAQVDPIWLNFTLSENQLLERRTEIDSGKLRVPPNKDFVVEAVLADGSVFPQKGHISFADAEFNKETGTYLLRATLPNPDATLRPGQFVRVRVSGDVRPNAILVPQQAVLQGAKGHFVFFIGKDGKAEIRGVKVGEWYGKDWFISEGLETGDIVVTEGVMKLAPGAAVKIMNTAAAQAAATELKPAAASDTQPQK
ncbi:MAG TPA: efflux RND transporter periplasmic adaptor subunit [Methylophilaceae bacterium]|nr:efflux RND transporter periplasmic adaptor subunit [Methylophilaceae bacterium]